MKHAFENLPYDKERRGPVEMDSVAFSAALTRTDVVVGLAALVAAAAAAAIVAEGGAVAEPTALTAVIVANIATLAVAGLLWRRSRPASRVGTLLLVEGLLVAVSSLVGSPTPGVHLVGVLAGWAAMLGVAWLILAFPRAGPRGAAWAVMSLLLATVAFGWLPLLLTAARLPVVSAVGQCAGACPANPLRVVHAAGAAHAFADVVAVLQSLAALAILMYMALHFMRANRPHRRTLALLYAAMVPLMLAFAATALRAGSTGAHVGHGAQAAFVAARIIAPLGFIGALLYARAYTAEALGYMSTRLVGEPSLAAVEHLVRSVLDDPLARLAVWLPGRAEFVDRHGKPIESGTPSRKLSWWSLRHEGEPILAIVHDSVLDEDTELLEAVGVATTLALENRRLHHDLVDTVQALHASQKRLVSAASEERRRLERDLHDGAQQKLVALRIRLDLARSRGEESETDVSSELDDVLQDLRSLAHGIFPPLLADEGLGAALREAARRSAVPVSVKIDDPGRLSPECETAVYYCCLEALQNVAKHAGGNAAATLRLWHDHRSVRFSVVDDGTGFVMQDDAGSFGLTNMTDRIGAVDGSLVVRSSPGAGTTVEGRIPLASARPAEGPVEDTADTGPAQSGLVADPVR